MNNTYDDNAENWSLALERAAEEAVSARAKRETRRELRNIILELDNDLYIDYEYSEIE